MIWTKWVTIHESYGLPRAAQECRTYLENKGIRVRLQNRLSKRSTQIYVLQVPAEQRRLAEEMLADFKKNLQ